MHSSSKTATAYTARAPIGDLTEVSGDRIISHEFSPACCPDLSLSDLFMGNFKFTDQTFTQLEVKENRNLCRTNGISSICCSLGKFYL